MCWNETRMNNTNSHPWRDSTWDSHRSRLCAVQTQVTNTTQQHQHKNLEVAAQFQYVICEICGPGSSVGISTELRDGCSRIESRWVRDLPPFQTGPGAHPPSCKIGTGSFPGVKCGRGVLLTTRPLLVPRSWKSRAIPLPTLWATPGLQRDHFTFTILPNTYWVRAGRSGNRILVGTRFSARPDRPWAHPASFKTGTGSFPGVKCGRGVLLTTHPLLVLRSWKSRAIPLPTLWATPGL